MDALGIVVIGQSIEDLMAYNQNIPQSTDIPENSQNDLLNNFTALYAAFNPLASGDHVNLNDVNAGKHDRMTLTQRAAASTFGATERGFYNLATGLFLHDGVTGKTVNITEKSFTSAAAYNYFYLTCRLLVKFGYSHADAGTHYKVLDLNSAGPAYTSTRPFAYVTGYETSGIFCVAGIVPNIGGASTSRYLRISTRTSTGGDLNNGLFFWLTIGEIA